VALIDVYPSPRQREAALPLGPALPLAAVPNVRIWPFDLRDNNDRATVVSPQFTGPAIVDSIVWHAFHNATGVHSSVSLWAADDSSGQGANQLLTARPSGQSLFDLSSTARDDAVTPAERLGIPFRDIGTTAAWTKLPIGVLVRKQNFFLKLSAATLATGIFDLVGYVRVLTAVPEDQLANFL